MPAKPKLCSSYFYLQSFLLSFKSNALLNKQFDSAHCEQKGIHCVNEYFSAYNSLLIIDSLWLFCLNVAMAKQKPTLNTADIFLLKKIFFSKKDSEKFATKKDLAQFATKKDLEKFATKIDLAKQTKVFDMKFKKQTEVLGKKLQKQRNDIVDKIFEYLQKHYVTKDEFNELKEKIDRLPTKKEFFEKMDEVIAEYNSFQEDRDLILKQYERIRQQLNLS